ncbi:MAG: 2-oxoglutarate dehydrogenase E1 component [Xanthomonadales bacterium]|nr:2-oxoglutarate dehydrogenase E1 component [Xanthomonadales bacterium]
MSSKLQQLYQTSHLYGGNASYIETWYETWLEDPDSVPEQWRKYFETMPAGDGPETGHQKIAERFRNLSPQAAANTAAGIEFTDHKQACVSRMINSFRIRGHEAARLNPLGIPHHEPVADLELDFHDLTETDLEHEFDTGSLAVEQSRMKLKDILALVRRVYCQSIGIEYMHMVDTAKRDWIRKRAEGSQGYYDVDDDDRLRILQMLTAAEGLEKYLHTRYVGQKRFSLEGGDSLIPLLRETMLHSGANGVEEIVIGMAHRGRLNVLVNILGKSPSILFDEFEGKNAGNDPDRPGDVKYHLGFASDIRTPGGEVHMALAFNPSHLEIVDPVVLGSARARQDRRHDHAHDKVMPILVHGDAAFAGQGVVMELFQMSETRGFAVGGTLHIIINNQIGFTTSSIEDTRSTLYCTAVAKMVHAPIFHVNADDPEAVHHVMKIACDFRQRFKRDVVIDLVCYRRHGHNEADEPAATQPMMYKIIRSMKTTREKYADDLVRRGVIEADLPAGLMDEYRRKLDEGEQVADVEAHPHDNPFAASWHSFDQGSLAAPGVQTALDKETVAALCDKLTTLPAGFELHPRVKKIIEDRRKMARGDLRLDWGFCENVAYASLIRNGTALRLVGQDSGRGTFFHRHAVLHNQADGTVFTPLAEIDPEAHVTIIDSLLSEEAVTGFEYGYATADPETLVIWEAQFGDFANGAQVVIDQFLSSGEAKWGRLCGLVMYLPHGYEGQGPEHSSARLERFMQLCSNNNIQVCVPTTPAQMFHMIRRQMLMDTRKPLIVMTPKSLLRNQASTSTLEELIDGNFQAVIDDTRITDKTAVKRVVLCSGKVYYDLADALRDEPRDDIAVVRIEQLYPVPHEDLSAALAAYPAQCEVAWCQEEPQNQGAWYQAIHNLLAAMHGKQTLFYAGRPSSASPATGYFPVHVEEQKALVSEAITPGAGLKLNEYY